MLKKCFILCLYLVFGAADFRSLQIASSICYNIFPTQLDVVYDEIVAGNKNPPPNIQCFTACLLQNLDMFVDGRISSEALKERGIEYMEDFKMDNIPKKVLDLEEYRILCDSAIDEFADECEVAYQFMECLYREMLPNLLPKMSVIRDL